MYDLRPAELVAGSKTSPASPWLTTKRARPASGRWHPQQLRQLLAATEAELAAVAARPPRPRHGHRRPHPLDVLRRWLLRLLGRQHMGSPLAPGPNGRRTNEWYPPLGRTAHQPPSPTRAPGVPAQQPEPGTRQEPEAPQEASQRPATEPEDLLPPRQVALQLAALPGLPAHLRPLPPPPPPRVYTVNAEFDANMARLQNPVKTERQLLPFVQELRRRPNLTVIIETNVAVEPWQSRQLDSSVQYLANPYASYRAIPAWQLMQLRAQTIRDLLLDAGIAPGRVVVRPGRVLVGKAGLRTHLILLP